MTDHYAVVNPEDLRPVAPPPPLDRPPGEHVCPSCGRRFDSAQALSGHVTAHNNEKKPCPECGKPYIPGPGMARHRQTTHGVAKGNGERAKSSGRKPYAQQRKKCPECGKEMRAKDMRRHLRDVHHDTLETPLLKEEPAWNVDDIFSSVVTLMFPSGVIPVAALMPLLRWRHATDEMLMEVQKS